MSVNRIAVWTIRLMADDEKTDAENQEVFDELNSKLNDVEDELSSSTPEGYGVKIDGS